MKAFRYFKTFTQITNENIGTLCALAGHFMNSIRSPQMIESPYYLMFGCEPPDNLISFASHEDFKNHSSYLKHLTLLQNMFFLIREFHLKKRAPVTKDVMSKISVGQFCLLRIHQDKTKFGWKLRERYDKVPYRIVKIFKKSLLVTAFNKFTSRQKFWGQGEILTRKCRKVKINDVKIIENPENFLKLSIPTRIVQIFDQVLTEREAWTKKKLEKIKLQATPETNEKQLIPAAIINNVQNKNSLFNSPYFQMPSLRVAAHKTRYNKRINKKNWTIFNSFEPTSISTEEDSEINQTKTNEYITNNNNEENENISTMAVTEYESQNTRIEDDFSEKSPSPTLRDITSITPKNRNETPSYLPRGKTSQRSSNTPTMNSQKTLIPRRLSFSNLDDEK